MGSASETFERAIDASWPARVSVVGRYRNAFSFGEPADDDAFKRALLAVTVREGAQIFPLLEYRGVAIHVLDESSLMHTGTLKSIDGCIAAAKCKVKGYERVVFESGGNTGIALTAYGQRAGVETFCVVPEANLPLLDGETFAPPRAHLVSVADRGSVKRAAHLIAGLDGIRHIPDVAWRFEASRFRGCFILEHSTAHGGFDWMAQTISAAFGPIGIYKILERFGSGVMRLPRFLGVQQEANCPMYSAWQSEQGSAPAASPAGGAEDLLTRVMYDTAPQSYGTYEDLKQILTMTRGTLSTVNRTEFDDALGKKFDGRSLLDLLGDHGVHIGTRDGDVVERTGLIALAGTLNAIDAGEIGRGSRVLCCLTSGTRPGDGRAVPDCRAVDADDALRGCREMLHGR